jgi:hypothetical protein
LCQESQRGYLHLYVESEPAVPDAGDAVVDGDAGGVTVNLHRQRRGHRHLQWELGGIAGRNVGAVRWTASIWPAARDSFFAGAALEIADNRDWYEAHWENRALLEPLLDPGTPLREMGLLLLVLGLSAKEPGEHGLAVDAAIAAVEDGRLGTDNLGPMLAALLPTGLVKPGRWKKTLAEVARISDAHALVVQSSLQQSLQGSPKAMPRNYGQLVEVLYELTVQLGLHVTSERCRDFLSQIRGSGKAAKAAKALLALPADPSPEKTTRALGTALGYRLDAAARHPALET